MFKKRWLEGSAEKSWIAGIICGHTYSGFGVLSKFIGQRIIIALDIFFWVERNDSLSML